jgi:NAD(P)H dehydrogenase (quinone)
MRAIILFLCLSLAQAAAQTSAPPVRILVAFHSETGNTEALAKAVRAGAASVPGVEVRLRRTAEVTQEEILQADGIALGTPVYWGTLSAETKRFLDNMGTSLFKARPVMGEGRAAAAFCTGGSFSSGKELARIAVLTAFLHMRFIVIGGVDEGGFGTLGAEATTGPDDPGLSEKELAAARRFGERFARLTRQIRVKE